MRRALACVAATLLALAGLSGVVASPAAADDWTLLTHRCAVIGTDQYGNQGIHCADLYYAEDNLLVQGRNSVYCQNAAEAVVECLGITETPGTCYTTPEWTCHYGHTGTCGTQFAGHTACGARKVINASVSYGADGGYSARGRSVDTKIWLPRSNKPVGGIGTSIETSTRYIS